MWLLPDSTADFPWRFSPFSNSYSSSDPTSLLGRHSTDIYKHVLFGPIWPKMTCHQYWRWPGVPGQNIVRSCNRGGQLLLAWERSSACSKKLLEIELFWTVLIVSLCTCNPYVALQRVKDWQRSEQRPREGRPVWDGAFRMELMIVCHLMRHWLLGILPLPAPVDKGDQEERAPEDEVGHRDHQEHLHPHHPLLLHPLDVLLDVAGGRGWALLRSVQVDHGCEETGNPHRLNILRREVFVQPSQLKHNYFFSGLGNHWMSTNKPIGSEKVENNTWNCS